MNKCERGKYNPLVPTTNNLIIKKMLFQDTRCWRFFCNTKNSIFLITNKIYLLAFIKQCQHKNSNNTGDQINKCFLTAVFSRNICHVALNSLMLRYWSSSGATCHTNLKSVMLKYIFKSKYITIEYKNFCELKFLWKLYLQQQLEQFFLYWNSKVFVF